MKKWLCSICEYIYESNKIPEACPVCNSSSDKFIEKQTKQNLSYKYRVGAAQDLDEDILGDLRDNYSAECNEVGMYLAMSRVAQREGYSEIAETYKIIAYEEAEHAAKFAELLGEVVDSSTEKNLRTRIEAEYGATEGKLKIAKKTKEFGIDIVHDAVHEMCKDEARHGKAFLGLLNKYFNE